MASANVQVVPTAQPMYMPVFWMVAHIMMKAGLVMVDMMEAAKLVMSLNIVMVALSHSLLEVMAMPDSKSYNILFKTLLSTFEEKVWKEEEKKEKNVHIIILPIPIMNLMMMSTVAPSSSGWAWSTWATCAETGEGQRRHCAKGDCGRLEVKFKVKQGDCDRLEVDALKFKVKFKVKMRSPECKVYNWEPDLNVNIKMIN